MSDEEKDIHGGFGLPEDYFSRSAGRLVRHLECMEELKDYKMLTSLKGATAMVVPDEYFSGQMEVSYIRTFPARESGFAVPAGFFKRLDADLKTIDHLSGRKTSAWNSGHRGKRRFLPLLGRKNLYYLAAATLLIALGLWFFQQERWAGGTPDCKTIACLDKKDVLGSVVMEQLNEEELIMLIDVNDLELGLTETMPLEYSDSSGKEPGL